MFTRSPQLTARRPGGIARLAGAIGALGAVGVFLAIPTTGAQAAWCAPSGPLSVADLPATVSPADCDLTGRTLVAGGVRVDVPTAGHGVAAAGHGADGEANLRVFTDPTGVVTIENTGAGAVGAASRATAPETIASGGAACRDSHYAGMGYKFSGTFTWYRNTANTPRSVSSTAGTAIIQATTATASGSNRCGFTRTPRLGQSYRGLTTRKPQVTAAGTCYSSGDGYSVTGWMRLPKVLAYTCSYYRRQGSKWVVSESDMALSTSFNWFTGSVPRGCTYTFDLRGVVAHERGHTFGLGHVSSGSSLTMAPYSQPCTTANRTLGYGDYRGLSTMYGTV